MIQLGYNIPIKDTSNIRKFGVYVTLNNVYTITKYSGYDPALNSFNNATIKIDQSTYPSTLAIAGGINLEF